ncbi:hypothetical protein CRG98_001116 [Punica granatum]|uniref:Uncharacterized protein n=1 Tax=Punica granatum TaxID=22663 RepID=A0A2I0LE27_PUNGR|nr:hypothetical protein CRG98_001116 [Punica granatum]
MKRWSQSESHTTVHNLRFTHSLLSGFTFFLPVFLSSFPVYLGPCTFETVHECPNPSLRSPRSLTSLGAVAGAIVPTLFFPDCHGRYLSGAHCPLRPVGSLDPLCYFPDSFPRTSRLGNTPLRLRGVRSSILGCCGVIR